MSEHPTGREIRKNGASTYSDPYCEACLGFGVLVLNGGPLWIPCTTCVWPGLACETPAKIYHELNS